MIKHQALHQALAVVFALSLATAANAAPVGNPAKAMAEQGDLSIGYEGDFTLEKDMDDGSTIEDFFAHSVRFGYTAADRVEIYGLIGAAQMEWGEESVLTFDTDAGLLVGGGLNVLVYEQDAFGVGLDGRYRWSQQDIGSANITGGGVTLTDSELTYQDWQIALGASYTMDAFTPYVGVKYSDAEISDLTITGSTIDGDNNADDNVGVFVGFDVELSDNIIANLEGRFIDEEAITAGLTMRY